MQRTREEEKKIVGARGWCRRAREGPSRVKIRGGFDFFRQRDDAAEPARLARDD